jgi:hypothetical protein
VEHLGIEVTCFRIAAGGISKDRYDLDQPRALLAPFSSERLHLTAHPAGSTPTAAGSYAADRRGEAGEEQAALAGGEGVGGLPRHVASRLAHGMPISAAASAAASLRG